MRAFKSVELSGRTAPAQATQDYTAQKRLAR